VQKKTDPEDVCLVDISEPSPAAIKGKKGRSHKAKVSRKKTLVTEVTSPAGTSTQQSQSHIHAD
jgi:hypothetical protein